ncbi:MAG: hypothetical protein AB9856_07780 [Cellulosilyticaceae bacterium]
MLKLSLIELFFRAIPDSALFITGAHIFSKTPLNKLKLFKSIFQISIIIYIIRSLPISYGIHTLLSVIAITVVVTTLHKIDLVQALKAVFITMLIQYGSELLNVAWIQLCMKQELSAIFSNPKAKILYGLPSLLISGSILYYCYNRRVHEENVQKTSL